MYCVRKRKGENLILIMRHFDNSWTAKKWSDFQSKKTDPSKRLSETSKFLVIILWLGRALYHLRYFADFDALSVYEAFWQKLYEPRKRSPKSKSRSRRTTLFPYKQEKPVSHMASRPNKGLYHPGSRQSFLHLAQRCKRIGMELSKKCSRYPKN